MTNRASPDQSRSMSEATLATMRTYDDEASSYTALTSEFHRFPGLDGELWALHEEAPAGLVLDAGCGPGRDARYLAAHGRDVVALDVSARLLVKVGEAALRDSGRVHAVRADLTALPFADSSFSGVWMCGSLLHVPASCHLSVLRDLHRVLIPGGVAAVSMKAGTRDGFTTGGSVAGRRWLAEVEPRDFADRMRLAGLDRVRTVDSGRGAWYVATGVRP